MTPEDYVGLGLVLTFLGLVAWLVSLSRLPRAVKTLVYAALALRVVGSWLRYAILFWFYGGSGDARRYSHRGREYAEQLWQLDFSPFYDPTLWVQGRWWGTQFVSFPSGLVVAAIGPSLLAEFIVFSMFAFVGLVGFAVAFRRAHPDIPFTRYARWIWLFPSLWYWPSSVGKDAIVLMGLGLAVAGFVGRRGRIEWFLMALGVFLVFAIRPQVAAVVILSLVLAHWLSLGNEWTPRKVVQGLAILACGLAGIRLSMAYIGVGGFDVEGVQGYMEHTSARAAEGDSAIDNVEVGLIGVPLALVNILTRPFLWEAHNPMALLSALEIAALWGIVWYRRRNFMTALRSWRSDRLLQVAVPFILIYAVTLGMLIVNLGIIARQRIFLFPFLFLLLEAVPARGQNEAKRGPPKTSRPGGGALPPVATARRGTAAIGGGR
jgi:hypothetical protein